MNDSGDENGSARLDAISRGVDDVRDEMSAGLAEVRQLVEQSREAVFRMESALAGSDPGASLRVAECIDGVRAIAEKTRRRQGVLIGVVAMQAVLLAVAIGLIVLMRGDVQRGPVISTDVTVEKTQTLSSVSEPRLVASPPPHVEHAVVAEPVVANDAPKARRTKRHR